MANRRPPERLATILDLSAHAARRRETSMNPELHRAVVHAATAAGPVIAELAGKGDAYGVLRVAEALSEVGRGRTVRALRILDEILSTYRDSPA